MTKKTSGHHLPLFEPKLKTARFTRRNARLRTIRRRHAVIRQQRQQLVDLLLTPAERERVTSLLASGRTHEFRLSTPLPIILAYWTAEVDGAGQLHYAPDIYARDQALLAALDRAQL